MSGVSLVDEANPTSLLDVKEQVRELNWLAEPELSLLSNQTQPHQTNLIHTKMNSTTPNQLIHIKPNSTTPKQTHPYQTKLNPTKPNSSIPNQTQLHQTKLMYIKLLSELLSELLSALLNELLRNTAE